MSQATFLPSSDPIAAELAERASLPTPAALRRALLQAARPRRAGWGEDSLPASAGGRVCDQGSSWTTPR